MIALSPVFRPLALTFSFTLAVFVWFTTTGAADASAPAQLVNISSRLLCETGDTVIVTEFAVQGPASESVLLRALGPSLQQFGVKGFLRNPTLTLLNARGKVLDSNDNWVDSPDKQAIIDTGIPPSDDHESAIIQTLSPGIYTSVVRGVHNKTGVAQSELYVLNSSDQALIPSIGTRGFVSTDDDVLISGFIVSGSNPFSVLVRALGPSLTAAGIAGALADPTLELFDGNGTLIAANNNWRDSQEAEIRASGFPPFNDLESALIVTVAPGTYTAVVGGLGDTIGIGFVQFYSLANRGPELNPAPIIRRGH